MELQERINVLKQGAEIAQRNGVLTLDEAYYAKQALDALANNTAYVEAFGILSKVAAIGQKKGVYTLKDAYLLYLATTNYESVIPQPQPQPQPQPAAEAPQPTRRSTKKES